MTEAPDASGKQFAGRTKAAIHAGVRHLEHAGRAHKCTPKMNELTQDLLCYQQIVPKIKPTAEEDRANKPLPFYRAF